MKTILRWVNPMPFLVTAFFFSSLQFSFAQSIFDANYNNFNFLAANKVHKVGTDGSGVGNITLYTNVITIGAQQIDCIVTCQAPRVQVPFLLIIVPQPVQV